MIFRRAFLVLFVLSLIIPGVEARPQEGQRTEGDATLSTFEDLAYPATARVARVQGVVVVEVKLDDKGNVVSASALSGPKPLIADSVSNAKKWKFKANFRKAAIIVYEFRLDDGACHDASHSLFLLRYPNFATITACTPVISG